MGERDEVSQKAWEWASLSFHHIWMHGAFVPVYKGIKILTVTRLHGFWCSVNGFTPESADAPPGVLELLVGRLCMRVEVLSLFWNTIHALDSNQLLSRLLKDSAVLNVIVEEMVDAA